MQERDFLYWLRGFFEINGDGPLTADQAKLISDHLKLVMTEVEKPKNWTPFSKEDIRRELALMDDENEHIDVLRQRNFPTVSCYGDWKYC